MAVRRGSGRPASLRDLATSLVAARGAISSGVLARSAGVSRQAAHRQLRAGVERGELVREGRGRAARYLLAEQRIARTFPRAELEEDRVLDAAYAALPELESLAPNAREIFEYALTEVVNNAVDHSDAARVSIKLVSSSRRIRIEVADDGVGAFEKLRRALGLDTVREALELLSKGKSTSDPVRHRGEEIFFVSRVVDDFELEANGLSYAVDAHSGDVAVSSVKARRGTCVRMGIDRDTERRVRDVLERHAVDHAFSKTRVSVRLHSFGTRFVTRSEAKRLARGLERFREVSVDFDGVERIGQGFADELFRVFARAHPETALLPENMSGDVAYAVRRARSGDSQHGLPPATQA
jgi:anti-sigma regulatory factor (Ser/Thr protein kinase)